MSSRHTNRLALRAAKRASGIRQGSSLSPASTARILTEAADEIERIAAENYTLKAEILALQSYRAGVRDGLAAATPTKVEANP